MGGTAGAKRKAQEAKLHSRPNKKFKKQVQYHSDSDSDLGTGPNATKVSARRDQRKIPPAAEEDAQDAEDIADIADVGEDEEDDDDDDDEFQSAEEDLSPSETENDAPSTGAQTESEDGSEADSDTDDSEISQAKRKVTKRRDPEAFASSINAILSSKLTTGNRKDPVLARSKTAATASHELAEAKLEAKAKRKLRDEKRALNEKGRVRNVLLGDRRRTPGLSESEADEGVLSEAGESTKQKGMSAAEIAEQERRLKKTAQRGVVKLFNAVRAAQVKAEEASRDAKTKSIVGVQRREEKVGEMGRQAFLDLVGKGDVGSV